MERALSGWRGSLAEVELTGARGAKKAPHGSLVGEGGTVGAIGARSGPREQDVPEQGDGLSGARGALEERSGWADGTVSAAWPSMWT
jgi:hypothetical protein